MCALLAAPCLAQDFSLPDETKPDPNAALIQQANDALAASNFAGALKILTGLDAKSPNNPQVLYDLGLATEALADSNAPAANQPADAPRAESYYRQAIAAAPHFAQAHVALGLLLARTGRAPEARTELNAAIAAPQIDPALKARALRALARIELDGDAVSPAHPDPATASADLLAALDLTPEAPEDVLLAAQIAEATPDLAAAEQAYRRYLVLVPNDPGATAALVHILLAGHHPAEAEPMLNQALAAHPGDPVLTAQLAAAWLASGDDAKIAQAAPMLEKLHAARPQDANITRLLARVYLETDHPEQAEPLYAALVSAGGAHPDPTLVSERAEALIRLHRPAEAKALLLAATADRSAFPTPDDFAGAAMSLAFAAAEADDPRTTLQALALRATVLPPTPSALYLEATARDALHQSSQAAVLYRQFLAAAHGSLPEQESQARQRLQVLTQRK